MHTPMRLRTDVEISKRYGIPLATLRAARTRGFGPAYLKLGRSVRYQDEDIDSWLKAARVQPGDQTQLTA